MKIYLLSACLFASALSFANTGTPVEKRSTPVFNDSTLLNLPSTNQMLTEILVALGLQQNFELKEAKVSNIEASISRGKRYILYNPAYISWINKATGDKWACMALIAHEIGHHLNGHTVRRSGSKPHLELEADEFAGFVLHKLGASLEQSQLVMKYIANNKGSKTHPARALRLAAIEKGWSRAARPGENPVVKN